MTQRLSSTRVWPNRGHDSSGTSARRDLSPLYSQTLSPPRMTSTSLRSLRLHILLNYRPCAGSESSSDSQRVRVHLLAVACCRISPHSWLPELERYPKVASSGLARHDRSSTAALRHTRVLSEPRNYWESDEPGYGACRSIPTVECARMHCAT